MGCVGAILAAAGSGLRFNQNSKPKQFIELGGRPLYVWSLDVLAKNERVDQIIICTLEHMVKDVADEARSLFPNKEIYVTAGGATRQDSVLKGLIELKKFHLEYVLVHDAARPFLTNQMINSTIECVKKHGACTAAIPVGDTVKKVQNQIITETVDRSNLILVQTPQAAKYDWLLQAHELAQQKGFATTDDAALLEACGHSVAVFAGSPCNIKVTQKEDIVMAELLSGSFRL